MPVLCIGCNGILSNEKGKLLGQLPFLMYFSLIGYWDKIFSCIPCKIYKIKKMLPLEGYSILFFLYMPNFSSESRKILILEGFREEFISIYPKWFEEKDKLEFVELISKILLLLPKAFKTISSKHIHTYLFLIHSSQDILFHVDINQSLHL